MSHLEDLIVDAEETNERGAPEITVTAKGLQMLNDGLLCARCLEDLRPLGAFPERCPTCSFPVREEQTRQLIQDVKKHERIGSRVNLNDELEMLGIWKPGMPI